MISRPFAKRWLAVLSLALTLGTHGTALSHEEHTPLGEEMEGIGKNLRLLRRQIEDPAKKESSLQLLAAMEARAQKAKEMVPAKAKDIPKIEQEKFVAAYQARITELAEAMHKISDDVQADRFTEAKKGLSSLDGLKKKGHREFSSEEDDH